MFKGIDYYHISDLLSEDELMIQKTVRSFIEERFMPVIREHHRNCTFPMELVPELGNLG